MTRRLIRDLGVRYDVVVHVSFSGGVELIRSMARKQADEATPSAAAAPPDGAASSVFGLGCLSILLAVVTVAVACGVATFVAFGGDLSSGVDQLQDFVARLSNNDLSVADVLGSHIGTSLSDDELIQQGRVPRKRELTFAERCRDSRGSCTADVTPAACTSDEQLRTRCCRSCHLLTCVDTQESCEDWASAGECAPRASACGAAFAARARALDLAAAEASAVFPFLSRLPQWVAP